MGKRNLVANAVTVVLLLAIGAVGGYRYGTRGDVFGVPVSWLAPTSDKGEVIYRVTSAGKPAKYKNVDFDLFWAVWDLLDKHYYKVEEMNGEEMVDGAIAGMVAGLGDPYTTYLPAKYNEINSDDLAGAFGGIGIEMGYKDGGFIQVAAPLDDTPAARAGLQTGDVLFHVKDEAAEVDDDIYEWSLTRAQQVLRGKIGTKLTLSILREGYNDDKPFEVELTRAKIKVDSVALDFKEHAGKTVAYIRLKQFTERTYAEWNQAVAQIVARKGKLAGVILDLRNNPGGYFSEAIHVANEFVKDGVLVVENGTKGKHEYSADGNGRLTDIPVVLLVNGGSASSSEIVAGALRDHQRATLVGEKTFGKGLIQQRFDLTNDAGLNITIAQWMLPGGDWLDKNGIDPGVEAKDDPETADVDEALERALEQF